MRRVEIGAAVLLTFAAIWLRWIAALSAGRLWRDEAAGVELANLPGLGAMWNNMQYDSFPALWLLLARAVGNVTGSTDDTALRLLGFIIDIGLVAVLWLYARAFRYMLPLVSLTLLGLAPSVIIWGDSARAYGLAMLTIILGGALIWRFVERPGTARFVVGEKPILLSGAPLPGNEWPEGRYRKEWSSMILYFLRQHATSIARVPLPRGGAVTPYEDVHLILATGWRP